MTDDAPLIHPFRWDITKRSQLGRLLDATEDLEFNDDTLVYWSGSYDREDNFYYHVKYNFASFHHELLLCSSKIIAFSANSDLCFVGRSPESIFDYLSGLLFDTSWIDRLNFLHFSMWDLGEKEIRSRFPGAIEQIRNYLTRLRLDPEQLARRERPVAFVDIVYRGKTFGHLFELLYNWCLEIGFDWSTVRRKIRIVGLTIRTETSPKTWRWHQHVDWASLLEPGSIKNISISELLFRYFGDYQRKLSESFEPQRWGDPTIMRPKYDAPTLKALKLAVKLFDTGREKPVRLLFAGELARRPAAQYVWYRDLILELKK